MNSQTTPESTQSQIEQPEQEIEPKPLQITAHDPNEVDIKSFKFKKKKEMEGKFRRAERILTVDDPDNPDDPIHFYVRALTPSEEERLQHALLSHEDIQNLVSRFTEKAETGGTIEAEDITDVIVEKLDTQNGDIASDRYLRKVQMGVRKPSGLTLQWFADLNPVLLELLHDTIDELRFEQEQWIINTSPAIRKASEEL